MSRVTTVGRYRTKPTKPNLYGTKPALIEAAQFTDLDSYLAIVAWWESWKTETLDAREKFEFRGGPTALMLVRTFEGWKPASPGDWIIRSTADEPYPLKLDVFTDFYESVPADEEEGTVGVTS